MHNNRPIIIMRNTPSQTINDIPIGQDVSSRYVCWIVGLMVFLLSLVFVGSISLSSSLSQWNLSSSGRITIELPLHGVQNPESLIETILSTLQRIPGVASVKLVNNQEVLKLLQPWVGQVNLLQDLTLPALIDVDMKPEIPPNVPEITAVLRQFAHGIRIEEHNQWQHMFEKLRLSLEIIAYLFISLIAITVMVTITLITRSSLATHASIIDVLRLVGANNSYIAAKFQRRAFWLALKGGLWGVIIALPTLFLLNWLSLHLGVSEVLKPTLSIPLLLAILSLPFVVGGISLLAARLSVLRTLSRLG
ncbi:MAG: FtsX-like permease family protein [Alphaproteobacteria bacterium]|nr:FtsX-like permease family protein [Alphaproteobacteria bacterium]